MKVQGKPFHFLLIIALIIVSFTVIILISPSNYVNTKADSRHPNKPSHSYKIPISQMNPQDLSNPEKIKAALKTPALGYSKEFMDFLNMRRKKIRESGSPVKRRDEKLIDERFSQLSYSAKKYLRYKYSTKATLSKLGQDTENLLPLVDQSGENIRVNAPSQDQGKNKTQSETSAASFGKTIVVSFNDSSGQEQRNFSGVAVSQDEGKTWSQTFVPSLGGFNLGDGVVTVDSKGTFYYAMIGLNKNNRSLVGVSRSINGGKTWTLPADASTTAGGQDDFQDKEWITADRSAKSPFKDNVYISWTRFPSTGTPKIMFTASKKRGKKFQPPIVIAESVDNSSVIQGSMVATGPNGEVYVVWSDRSLVGLFSPVLIRFSKSTDGGKNFSAPTTIAKFVIPGYPANGVFSGNVFPSIGVDTSNNSTQGNIYVVYSGRAKNVSDRADVFLVSSKNGGNNWSDQIKLNDDNSIAEQILPSVAVADDGSVAASWYDRRNDLTNLSLLDIYSTVSKDGGNTFSPNQRITNTNWPLIPTPLDLRGGYHGDYSQLATMGNKFLFNWGDDRSGTDTDVYIASRSADELASSTKAGFVITARDSSRVVKSGGLTRCFIQTKVFEGDKNFTFEASPNIAGLSYEFVSSPPSNFVASSNSNSPDPVDPPQEGFGIVIKTTPTLNPGPYFITVSAKRGDLVRSTTIRLTVLDNSSLAKIPQNITNNASGSILPFSSIDPVGNINVAWLDDSSGIFSIFFSRSTDNGNTFSTPTKLARNESFIGQPVVFANEREIYIVHLEVFDTPKFITQTQILRSTDGGQSFNLVNTIQDDSIFVASETAQMDVDGTIHISASTLNPDDPQKPLFAAIDMRSTDGGKTFSRNKVFEDTAPISNPILILEGDGKTVRAVFFDFSRQRGGLFLATSIDGGLTYAPPSLVTNKTDDLVSATLTFTSDLSHFILNRGSFQDEKFQLFYTNAGKDGKFSTPKLVSGDAITVLSPSLGADDLGNVIIAFEGSFKQLSDMDYSSQIFYCNSTDKGTTFSTVKSFQPTGTSDFSPVVLQDLKNNFSILWEGINKNALDIFYSSSPDSGRTFPAQVNLTNNAGISVYADLSFDKDGAIQLLLQDNTVGSFDIFRTKLSGN